jgi:hypothetical protein
MVLETVFEAAEGRVALIDFMPIGHANSSVIRLVKGQRGKVAMRLHLTLRFDYGATVPWVTQLEHESGLSAVAGPSRVALRSAVKLEGKNFATVAEFDVAEGECVPFVLTHVQSLCRRLLRWIGARRCRRRKRSGAAGRPAAATPVLGGNRYSAPC